MGIKWSVIIIGFLLGLTAGLIWTNVKLSRQIGVERGYVIDRSLPAVGIRGPYFKMKK